MSLLRAESTLAQDNPLDMLEELVSANEWHYQRSGDEEMVVELRGQWCEYRMFFAWQADLGALYFSCLYDLQVPKQRRAAFVELLSIMNERLWLGHFDLCSEEMAPMFRHTIPLRGTLGAVPEQLEDLLETAVVECERFFPAFHFLIKDNRKPQEAVEAALLDPIGEA